MTTYAQITNGQLVREAPAPTAPVWAVATIAAA